MHKPLKNQRGVGHSGIILGVAAAVLVAGASYFVWHNSAKDDTSGADQSLQDTIKSAKCDYDDQDICKFFASRKTQAYSSLVTTTIEADGSKTTSTIKSEGTKYSMDVEGATSYAIIQIGDTSYTRASDGTWWKQTQPKSDLSQYKAADQTKLEEPTATAKDTPANTTYTNLGKEKCGNLTCFKYQVTDPGDNKITTYIWFDDQDYQLRRMQTTGQGNSWEATYDYSKTSIEAPSPTKDLQPGQYLVPGQSQPISTPASGSY